PLTVARILARAVVAGRDAEAGGTRGPAAIRVRLAGHRRVAILADRLHEDVTRALHADVRDADLLDDRFGRRQDVPVDGRQDVHLGLHRVFDDTDVYRAGFSLLAERIVGDRIDRNALRTGRRRESRRVYVFVRGGRPLLGERTVCGEEWDV